MNRYSFSLLHSTLDVYPMKLHKKIAPHQSLWSDSFRIPYFCFSSSAKNLLFSTLMYVPFIPKERDSITPALSNLLNQLTMTEGLIPRRSAILDGTNKHSFQFNSLKMS